MVYDSQQSNNYYVKFTSDCDLNSTLPQSLSIGGKSFSSAGRWFSNGLYHYSWFNNSGIPIDSNNFVLGETGITVNGGEVVNEPTLSLPDLSISQVLEGTVNYKVYSITGQLLGDSVEYLTSGIYILVSDGYSSTKIAIE